VTGFRLSERILNTKYEFTTFRLRALIALTRPDAPDGMLTDLPVYRSVWTTLHGLAWGDMGFFTNPTRHGTRYPFYLPRHVPPWLASSVLVLALVPGALAIVGFAITIRRWAYVPISLMTAVGWLLYLMHPSGNLGAEDEVLAVSRAGLRARRRDRIAVDARDAAGLAPTRRHRVDRRIDCARRFVLLSFAIG
jgi:hypothetical protein